MNYTSIHVHGNLLTEEILNSVERDKTYTGNSDSDYGEPDSLSYAIDYAWSSLRADYNFFTSRPLLKDQYGTTRSRNLTERLLQSLGYSPTRQYEKIVINEAGYDITYLAKDLNDMPFLVVGDIAATDGDGSAEKKSVNSLDARNKGMHRQRSPHATMLAYLNSTDNIYGVVSNGITLRLIRSSGQLVKFSYIEFDIRKMVEEDKYTEFCLMYRLLHASRFKVSQDKACIFEQWFNASIESGNRIRDGLSDAVQKAMEGIANAALQGEGEGNQLLRNSLSSGLLSEQEFNKELIHFIYRLLFLFIIEDRKLIFDPDFAQNDEQKAQLEQFEAVYYEFYAASRLRRKSELSWLKNREFNDLWTGLMETFRLFESGSFGEAMGIKPLGGRLFNENTLRYLKNCSINNEQLLKAFSWLDEFSDPKGAKVRINYAALNVEEFGSVYEGILEMRPRITQGSSISSWYFEYDAGLERKTTSSFYTRQDLVQALLKITLEPAIKERISQHESNPKAQVDAMLSMKVCDPACGSGHFVLAMARTIAWYVCSIRTGEDNPVSSDYRRALHEVIARCIYAVDLNPEAVELCKLVLWIEGYCAGMPLSFLDHHIKCGNSVVGLGHSFDMLFNGVPKEAFAVKQTDKETDKAVKKAITACNKAALEHFVTNNGTISDGEAIGHGMLLDSQNTSVNVAQIMASVAATMRKITDIKGNTEADELRRKRAVEEVMASRDMQILRNAANIYTYSYFHLFDTADQEAMSNLGTDERNQHVVPSIPYTGTVYSTLQQLNTDDDSEHDTLGISNVVETPLTKAAAEAASKYQFFHWAIEFPEVFADNGGFDVMCGNPPWDKLQLEERPWFAAEGVESVASITNTARREKAIAALEASNPLLYSKYISSLHKILRTSAFVRESARFLLTAVGNIDLFPLFAELCLSCCKGIYGLILPTGIATNDRNKLFFQKLTDENRLRALYNFENREKIFKIDSRFRFCMLAASQKIDDERDVKVGFLLTRLDQILDENRVFTLKSGDFEKFNPNTRTCSVFRTSFDASLTSKIYEHSSVIYKEIDEHNEDYKSNPWSVLFGQMFNMSHDSDKFRTFAQLNAAGAKRDGSNFVLGDKVFVPLYEGKMIWHYNHHYSGYDNTEVERPNTTQICKESDLAVKDLAIEPWYWVESAHVDKYMERFADNSNCSNSVVVAFRDITNATNERTFISAFIPYGYAAGNKAPLIFMDISATLNSVFLSMVSSLVFDYATRQKASGTSMNLFIVKQLPVLRPDQIDEQHRWEIVKRVAELTYFNHDMDAFADELAAELTDEQNAQLDGRLERKDPWTFNEERRAVLMAELDVIIASLYGLNEEELMYILDPETMFGEGCIHETFRVLKENETKEFGEYRTYRLVMDAWQRLQAGTLFN